MQAHSFLLIYYIILINVIQVFLCIFSHKLNSLNFLFLQLFTYNRNKMNLEVKLKEVFGYEKFRAGQKQIIEQVLSNHDTLGILPTGAGKSICYQLPAVIQSGITLVISPLISLMKDQVDQLNITGIPATFINSTLNEQESKERMQQVLQGHIKILFVAPERFELETFNHFVKSLPLDLIAIDEAHCISQWGHDFRPSYLTFAHHLRSLPTQPTVLALTATATPQVTSDIQTLLSISANHTIKTGFLRENLHFEVVKGIEKRSFLKKYLHAQEALSAGIIYASTRKEVDEVYTWLNNQNFPAVRYHAGLSESERQHNQEQFLFDEIPLMVATNAFGMGINKPNVRFVIHYGMPATIESYYQEAGRAGRDGLEADAILLYSPNDLRIRNFLIEQGDGDEQHKEQAYEKLRQMQAYTHSETCLQRYILKYFGDEGENCGKCTNCLDDREQLDITVDAQKVLSCVIRMGERFGKTMVAQVLVGSKNKNLTKWKFEQLSTFGIMKQHSQKNVGELIDFLVAEGYLQVTPGKFPLLFVSTEGHQVLRGHLTVFRRAPFVTVAQNETGDNFNSKLFDHLRTLRLEVAKDEGVPPFMIFSDSSLKDMAEKSPQDETSFLSISGVGPIKLKKYGQEFIQVIQNFNNKK